MGVRVFAQRTADNNQLITPGENGVKQFCQLSCIITYCQMALASQG
jgi:hypothetical protein